jgi:hypothetical protein
VKKSPHGAGSVAEKDCALVSLQRANRRGGWLLVPVVQQGPKAIDPPANPDTCSHSPLVLRVLPIALLYHLLIHCPYSSSRYCCRFASGHYG